MLVAQGAILLERRVDGIDQPRRRVGLQHGRRHRRPIQDRVEHHRRRRAGEGLLSCHHLVQHEAQREDVGTGVDLFAARLFRRHVGDSAQRGAGHGERTRDAAGTGRHAGERHVVGRRRQVAARGQLRQAEVEQFRALLVVDDDVRRFDVAVHDALGVCRGQRVGELDADVEHVGDAQRPASDAVAQRLALQQFHHEVGRALVHADVVNRADAGMAERAGGPRLEAEALEGAVAAERRHRQELQRHLAAQSGVFRHPDHAHAAGAELTLKLVRTDELAGTHHAWRPRRPASTIGRPNMTGTGGE